MADKDFQVKNGLVVNSNNYGGANRLTVNATAIRFGNATSNVTINSSSFAVGALVFNASFKPASATLADVAVSVGSIHGANVVSNLQLQDNLARYSTTSTISATYQTMAGLSANVATLTSANSTRLNAKLESGLNVNSAVTSNSSNSATYSDVAGTVGNNGSSTGSQFTFTYTPQLGAPNFVWGTNDGVTYRPFNPANFTATTATNVSGGTVSATTGSFSGDMSFNSGFGSAGRAFACRAWALFNPRDYTTVNISISRVSGVSTITYNNHGLTTGDVIYIDANVWYWYDEFYAVTVTGPNTFTVVDSYSGYGNVTTSGQIYFANIYGRGNVSRVSVPRNDQNSRAIIFFTDPMPDTVYATNFTHTIYDGGSVQYFENKSPRYVYVDSARGASCLFSVTIFR